MFNYLVALIDVNEDGPYVPVYLAEGKTVKPKYSVNKS